MNNKLATETCVDYKINSKANEIVTTLENKSFLLYGGEQFPVNANMNDYTTCGTCSTQSNATASTFTNCPTSLAFTLYVYDALGVAKNGTWSYRIQEIVDYQGYRYFRWGETNGGTTYTWSTWRAVGGYDAQNISYGSNGSIINAIRNGGTVTVYCQINTADLGTMSSWQTKNLGTLNPAFRFTKSGYLLFPVVHDSAQNVGGCFVIYQSGAIQYTTRGGSLPGVATSAWVYATCTYVI